jgi:hypothetical protein
MDTRAGLLALAISVVGVQQQSGATVQLVALQHLVRFLLPAVAAAAELNQAA